MSQILDVYLYGARVATVANVSGRLRFRYLPEYVHSPHAIPISVQLPVTPATPPSKVVHQFLDNLLPDRADVRRRWAREAGLPDESPFELLRVYGADVAGAIEFYPAGTIPHAHISLSPLTDADIAERIASIRADDTDWTQGGQAIQAFSLGGAQGKFALARTDGAWFEPAGASPSTHIFKPGVAGLEGSDVTEYITLEIARRLGIDAASSTIAFFGEQRTLVVERFDRLPTASTTLRLHQEDLAQATGTQSLNKYERDNGPRYREIFDVFSTHLPPHEARTAQRRFAESLVFAWIVGHNDGHAKNYSLTHLADGSFLSPLYDLNSILAFQTDNVAYARDYRAFDKIELAFSISGAHTIGDVSRVHLHTLNRDAELAPGHLERFAISIAKRLQPAVQQVIDTLPAAVRELPAVHKYPHVTYAQTQRVYDFLGEEQLSP